MRDVIIIGAGVIGCSIARELSKYPLKVTVVEKELDVACGASKANSGIVHAGEDPVPGTLKAKMNLMGNAMFDQLQAELDFPFRRNGSLVLCFEENRYEQLVALRDQGLKNGVPPESMHLLNHEEALALEPNLSQNVFAALYLETGGIISPYEYTIALADNAAVNGVEFKLGICVEKVKKENDYFEITTSKENLQSRWLINAAGLHSDDINNMLSSIQYKIVPKRGEYILLDKLADGLVDKTLFQLPTALGKGILVTPTVHGNLLLGPTAIENHEKEETSTSLGGLNQVLEKAKLSVSNLPVKQVITSFAGQRAHEVQSDFVLGTAPDVPHFINALGIESPGLTSSPAIAKYLVQIIADEEQLQIKPDFNPIRKSIKRFADASVEEKEQLIKTSKKYSHVICRCETVTEAEILAAIHGPVAATTLDAVKRRTRAGMGRCQSGFCMNQIVKLLSEALSIPEEEVLKSSQSAPVLMGEKLKASLKSEVASND